MCQNRIPGLIFSSCLSPLSRIIIILIPDIITLFIIKAATDNSELNNFLFIETNLFESLSVVPEIFYS